MISQPQGFRWLGAALAAALTFSAVPASAGDSLFSTVPDNACVAVQYVNSDKDNFVEEYWADAFDALKESGVVDSVVELILSEAPPAEARQAREAMGHFQDLLFSIDWKAMFSQEVVFAMRWEEGGRATVTGPEGDVIPRMWPSQAAMFRMGEEAAARNAEAFGDMLSRLEGAIGEDEIKLESGELHGAEWVALNFGGVFELCVARKGGDLYLGFAKDMIADALALGAGEDADVGRLVDHSRFVSAFERLPAADTYRSYVDIAAMMGSIQNIVDAAFEMDGSAGRDPQAQQVRAALSWLFANVSAVDRIASTTHYEGRQAISEEIAFAVPGYADTLSGRMVANQRAFEDFDKFVPKGAKSFTIQSGANPLAVYEVAAELIGRFPDGGAAIAMFEEKVREATTMSVREDMLAWMGGEMVSVTFPSLPMQPGDQASLLGLRDADQAMDMIATLFSQADTFLQMAGQPPLVTDAAGGELGKRGFVSITHPTVQAMNIKFVMGVEQNFLMFGTPNAMAKVFETMNGKGESIADDARFQKEGVTPEGPATAVSYADVSGDAANIAMTLGMMGMFSGMLPPDPETDGARQLLMILQRLAPVAQKMDFFKTTASATTFDGDSWHKTSVVTYK